MTQHLTKTDRLPKKGDTLELATAAFFQAHGYLVRRGVMLAVAAGTADATDIDLLAIRFQVPVKEERLIVDCKDRKRSRPFERVLWTLGLTSFTKAQRSIIVAPAPASQARDFAAQGSVEVLPAEQVIGFVKGREVGSPYGDADSLLAAKLNRMAQAKTLETKELMRELARIRQMLVIGNTITNFNRLILAVRRLRGEKSLGGGEVSWLRDHVCNNAAVVATVMLLRFVEEAKWAPEKDWRSSLTKRFTYGDVAPSKAVQLARLALDKDFHDGLPAPEYTEEVLGLVAALIANPSVSVWAANAVDFLLFAGRGELGKLAALPDNLHAEALLLGRRVISTLGYATGTPNSFEPAGVVVTAPAVTHDPPAKPEQAVLPIGDSKVPG